MGEKRKRGLKSKGKEECKGKLVMEREKSESKCWKRKIMKERVWN